MNTSTLTCSFLAVFATGCASDAAYLSYLEAQRNAQSTAYANQKPLVRITAQEGQAITGLAGIEINLPTEAPRVEQQRPSEWAGVMSQALGVAGVVGGIYASGKAAKDLAGAVGMANTSIASQIQAPGAVTTTTSTTSSTVAETDSRNTATTTTTATGSYNPTEDATSFITNNYPQVAK